MDKKIVLKKSVIISQEFAMAFQKLASTPLDNAQAAYWVSRIFSKLKSRIGEAHKEYQTKIIDAFAERGADGKPAQAAGQPIKIMAEKEKECDAAVAAFELETVNFDHIRPLKLSDLGPIKFSGRELELLEGIYEPPAEPTLHVVK